MLLAARFVLGIAVGCAALVVPLYLSEIAPTEIRGAISSLNQLMIVGGILVAFLVNAVLASSEAWRVMLGLAVVPSLVLLVGMIWMPETPRFLVHKGEEDEAKRGARGGPRRRGPEEELEDIRKVEAEEEGGGLRALGAAWVRPALLVAIGLAVFQQLVGINTIIYYAPTTLTNVGYSDQSAIYANIAIGVLNVGDDGPRDPARRPRRPQAAAAGRAGRHGHQPHSCSASRSRSCPSRTRRATRPRSSRSSASGRSSRRSPPRGARSSG